MPYLHGNMGMEGGICLSNTGMQFTSILDIVFLFAILVPKVLTALMCLETLPSNSQHM